LPELIEAMMAALDGLEFDTIAMAPSSRSDAVPFTKAVTERWPDARDITDHFSKGSTKAADDGDLRSLVSSMGYTADDKEELIGSLLIVDESIATGKTAAAMIERLKAAGMGENVDVTLVACCWMKPPKT
jgi:predicted phosphoribosyltransferase